MVVIGAGGCTVKVSVIAKKEAWNEVISRPLLEVDVNSEGACNQLIYGIQQIKSLVHFKSQIFDNDTLTHLPTYPCPCNINSSDSTFAWKAWCVARLLETLQLGRWCY